ncbi:MAG: hypothetical protein DRJ47_06725 [Thermoprotei archaeon]|nr:MAG: hypothetical protein DRJ47_06725 [Thermoprotei archaeon]
MTVKLLKMLLLVLWSLTSLIIAHFVIIDNIYGAIILAVPLVASIVVIIYQEIDDRRTEIKEALIDGDLEVMTQRIILTSKKEIMYNMGRHELYKELCTLMSKIQAKLYEMMIEQHDWRKVAEVKSKVSQLVELSKLAKWLANYEVDPRLIFEMKVMVDRGEYGDAVRYANALLAIYEASR